MNIPFVGLNHHDAPDWACIGTDNVEGGYLAGKHLVELGHQEIAYVGNQFVDAAGFKTSGQRFGGLQKALSEVNLSVHPDHIKLGFLSHDNAKEHTLELLQLKNRPTAIFAMSDTQALGCISALRESGLRVPEDISVIGYDDLEIASHVGLSTVRQHLELSGTIAMDYLLNLLKNLHNTPVPKLPKLEIVHRLTTLHKP
jgi:DNA-binding LacI/PurR family transcriptional regulator